MATRIKEKALATIKMLIKILPAALLSAALSMVLVRCIGESVSSKILGADNSDIRSIYYHSIAESDNVKDSYDQLVVYNPITNHPGRDKLVQLADELRNVSKYHPRIIVFDYILVDTASYSTSAKIQMLDAIKECLDSGIVFIAAEEKYVDPHSNIAIHNSSFFVNPPYFLNVERGNTATMFNRVLDNSNSDDDVLWMPLVVSKHAKGIEQHPASFYNQRYINFSPGHIEIAFNGHPDNYLRKKISSKIVIFSSYTAVDDMHVLPFPVKTIPEGDIDYNYRISGAELLWYTIRDEIYDKWDVKASFSLILLLSFLCTFFYCILRKFFYCKLRKFFYFILKRRIFVSNKCRQLGESFVSFFAFMLGILVLILVCYLLMSCWHLVFPIPFATVSLVIVNLFEPLWWESKN